MRIHIGLHVFPDRIRNEDWAAVYDDSLRLFQALPGGPLGLASRAVAGHSLNVYTPNIETDWGEGRSFSVCGDGASLCTAGTFRMPRALPRVAPPAHEARRDIALGDPERRFGGHTIFDASTASAPFHIHVLAAAMIVEDRFPGAAIVTGDIAEEDAEEARVRASRHLGRPVALPVLLSAEALWQRLGARHAGQARLAAFRRRYLGDERRALARLFAGPLCATAREHVRGAPIDEALVLGFLEGTNDPEALFALFCLEPEGPRRSPAELVQMLGAAGLWLPPDLRRRLHAAAQRERPAHGQVSPEGLLARLFLAGFSRWTLQADPAGVEAVLARAFPAERAALMEIARGETTDIEHLLCDLEGLVNEAPLVEPGQRPSPELGRLAAVRVAAALSEEERRGLGRVGALVRERRRDGSAASCAVACRRPVADLEARRRILARLGARRGPVLTEAAWGWIMTETSQAMTDLVLDLLWLRGEGDFEVYRRAALENRVLCTEVLRAMART
jgi:hypothetical protein